jgi:hypothetical protein
LAAYGGALTGIGGLGSSSSGKSSGSSFGVSLKVPSFPGQG